ncbi:MAG: hypothetical protein J0M34_00030 [Alphaproteobacteria bacterium]|nr:hypothetical protein [Alphaproteobacteria bacterium]
MGAASTSSNYTELPPAYLSAVSYGIESQIDLTDPSASTLVGNTAKFAFRDGGGIQTPTARTFAALQEEISAGRFA